MKEWLKLIDASKKEFKNAIAEIEASMKIDRQKGRQEFAQLQACFYNSVPEIAKNQINLFSELLPNSFKVTVISQDEYTKLTTDLKYGFMPFYKKEAPTC